MKNRLRKVMIAVVLLITISGAAIRYYSFVIETIYKESVLHLSELFDESICSLQDFAEKNWMSLHLLAHYLEDVSNAQQVEKYVEHTKAEAGFTEFYFVGRDGKYYTVDGTFGYFNLENALSKLIIYGQDTVVKLVVPGDIEQNVFFTPVKGSYKDFEYEAIAVGFSNDDLVKALEISAFGNSVSRFIVHKDGRVILDISADGKQDIYNFLAMLRDYSNLSNEEVDSFQNDLKQNASGAKMVHIANEDYYLIFEPVGFEEWSMVGLVPVDIVNASMNKLQYGTFFIAIGIMVTLSVFVISIIIRGNKTKLQEKDAEIVYRDELFSKLSTQVDDVFLMIDANRLCFDYISPNIEKLMGITVKEARTDIHVLDRLLKDKSAETAIDKILFMRTGQQEEWDRVYIHQKSGEERWFHNFAICSRIQSEVKYILVMSDRTEDKMVNRDSD